MHFVEARGILSQNNGMNIYRGCTHGCIYCDSRSACYGFTHSFEDIEVKKNAPELLEEKLRSRRRKCIIRTGAMCDPYMHCEEKLMLTRRCLSVIERYGFGISILTKSDRILRDLDLLSRIHQKARAVVQMTITTFDDHLCKIIEPNVCVTSRRVAVLKKMREAGLPTVVWLTPVLPFINDTEENIRGLLEYAKKAQCYGILFFDIGVTLRDGDRQYFYEKLDAHFPGMKEKYRRTFGEAYEVPSPKRKVLAGMVKSFCQENGMVCNPEQLFAYMRTFEDKLAGEQMSLFDF